MDKIPSFNKNHDIINPGFYLSTTDRDLTTFDLRFIKPNCGKYISNAAMHSIEHILATILRNSSYKDSIVYFGPMGCRTGFYLITRDLDFDTVKNLVIKCIKDALEITTVPGAERKECGNYKEHNLSAAKMHLKKYLRYLV